MRGECRKIFAEQRGFLTGFCGCSEHLLRRKMAWHHNANVPWNMVREFRRENPPRVLRPRRVTNRFGRVYIVVDLRRVETSRTTGAGPVECDIWAQRRF
ncbi:MAG: hypothetical protein ACLFT2_07200, partial [Candidatus Brocadiia bacterium]